MLPVIEKQPIIIQKTPNADFDETINWACATRGLGGDIISESEWTVSGDDDALVISDESIAIDGKSTTVWMSGGTLGKFYAVNNTVTTSGDRILPTESFQVEIVERVYITQPRCI